MEWEVVLSLACFARERYTDKGLNSEFLQYEYRSFEEFIFAILLEPDILTDTRITDFSLIHEDRVFFFIEFRFQDMPFLVVFHSSYNLVIDRTRWEEDQGDEEEGEFVHSFES